MKLRRQQVEAFSEAAAKSFEDRMVDHVGRFFPDDCERLGERVRQEVRYGIERAESYGLRSRRDICKFLDVMFAFGRDFETKRKFRWADEILHDPAVVDPAVRAGRLLDEAQMNYDNRPSMRRKWKG